MDIENMTEKEIFAERNRMRKKIADAQAYLKKNEGDKHISGVIKELLCNMWIAYNDFLKDITKDNEISPMKEYK